MLLVVRMCNTEWVQNGLVPCDQCGGGTDRDYSKGQLCRMSGINATTECNDCPGGTTCLNGDPNMIPLSMRTGPCICKSPPGKPTSCASTHQCETNGINNASWCVNVPSGDPGEPINIVACSTCKSTSPPRCYTSQIFGSTGSPSGQWVSGDVCTCYLDWFPSASRYSSSTIDNASPSSSKSPSQGLSEAATSSIAAVSAVAVVAIVVAAVAFHRRRNPGNDQIEIIASP